jgi:hypothetical protein
MVVSAAKLEANRRNAARSTGPRSACGKSRSRFNALKHGMTARQPLLPDEDAAELAAEVEALGDELQPRNKLEAMLVEGIAGGAWRSEQSERAADGRAAFRIRHWGPKKVRRERHQALELGERLFWQPAFPLPSSASYEMGFLTEPPSSVTEFDIEKDNGNAIKAAVQCEPFMRRLEQLPLSTMAPPGEVEAREWLAQRIEHERERVERIREEVAELAEADAAQASPRLMHETAAEGDRHRRYLQSKPSSRDRSRRV